MTTLLVSELTLPLQDPILKFLVILIIILFAPILFNKVKIPHILGLIIAGAIIGPFGINLLQRDGGIILSGTAGLLYIMFIAGLEIDLAEFKKNSSKSIVFGLLTFSIPMTLGTLAGVHLLHFTLPTSVLLASMFASHTLIAYPIISKMGVTKQRAVNVAVGGTMITDTLALLVLAVIVGMTAGEVNTFFWTKLGVSLLVFALIIMIVFPIIGRWFFKRYEDHVAQYVFVLVMVFLGAVLAEMAGIEAIIGAFLSGLALNRLIPGTSSLMNKIDFVGNAIFIPFFLIGVGMLVDYRVFIKDFETIKVALVMIITATSAKFIASWLTQKIYGYSTDERNIIFGLSNAQAAATLAAVTVGYKVNLLNESVLNGTIIMILVTCTIASLVTQKASLRISLSESADIDPQDRESSERILIPIRFDDTIDELVNLTSLIKSKSNMHGYYALNVINHSTEHENSDLNKAHKLLDKALSIAAAADIPLNKLIRYDVNVVNGITSVIRENKITDLVLSLSDKKGISDSFLGNLAKGILMKNNISTYVYKPVQPISTIKRHIVIIPKNAELEIGFPFWLVKIWNIALNTGAKIEFHGCEKTLKLIRDIYSKHHIEAKFHLFEDWDDFLILSRDVESNDNLILVLARDKTLSYQNNMERIPGYLQKYFQNNSFILIYPMQANLLSDDEESFKNPSMLEPIEKLDEIGKTIARLFKKKQ